MSLRYGKQYANWTHWKSELKLSAISLLILPAGNCNSHYAELTFNLHKRCLCFTLNHKEKCTLSLILIVV